MRSFQDSIFIWPRTCREILIQICISVPLKQSWKIKMDARGWSRADLRLVYWFWEHLIWSPKFKKARTRKTNVLHKNKKLPSLTLFSQFNIELEHINAVNRTKNNHSTLIFLCFLSCPQSKKKKNARRCQLGANMVAPRVDPCFKITLPTPILKL